jgi:hypothetical protein
VLVAHACNPYFSGGRDQGSKPTQVNSETLSQRNPSRKSGGVAQGKGSEFKHQYCKQNKTKNTCNNIIYLLTIFWGKGLLFYLALSFCSSGD